MPFILPFKVTKGQRAGCQIKPILDFRPVINIGSMLCLPKLSTNIESGGIRNLHIYYHVLSRFKNVQSVKEEGEGATEPDESVKKIDTSLW